MTRSTRQSLERLGRLSSALTMTVLALSGCANPQKWVLTSAQVEERTPFTAVSNGQAWVNAPGISAVLQRTLRGGSEQRLSLANESPVPGDNVILLRTRTGSAGSSRLRFESLISAVGSLPPPFTDLSSGDLIEASDEVGTYLYAVQPAGSGNCTLGIRRVDSGMRQLPGNAVYMDIILRNCVNGTPQDALVPLMAGSIGVAPVTGEPLGNNRMLSPLAAPSSGAVAIPIGMGQQ